MEINNVEEYKGHYISSSFSNSKHSISCLLVFTKTEPSTIIYEWVGKEQGVKDMMLFGALKVQTDNAKKFIDNFIKGGEDE